MPIDTSPRHAALARLARNNIVGLHDLAEHDLDYKEAAFARFVKRCEPGASEGDARRIFDEMCKVLREARLTINFDSGKWFAKPNASRRYENMFAHAREPQTDFAQVMKLKARNLIERRMFNYGEKSRVGTPNAEHAQKSIAYYGDTHIDNQGMAASPSFDASLRPRYGGLDFAHCTFGAAGDHRYGHSFLILKEHVKHTATYLHTDSFKAEHDLIRRREEYGGRHVPLEEATATYFQLEKILLYCTPTMLSTIYDYATGRRQRGEAYSLPPDTTGHAINYIEFQAHSDIDFHRDVEAMVIYRPEAAGPRGGHGWANTRRAKAFARENGIPIRFIDYDPSIRFKLK